MSTGAADLLPSRPNDAVIRRRAALFRETPFETIERWVLGAAWALKPGRAGGVPALLRLWLANLAAPSRELPDPERALENPPGLCGIAHDLSVPTLLAAYRRGLFPGGHIAPVKWFSPPERCVLFFDEFRLEKSARRLMRKGRYRVTFDQDFEGVIKACAGRRPGKWHLTWITPRIMRAYAELFDARHAHSVEVWNEAGELAGGLYGVAIGRAFFGESMFSHEANASKIGQAVLTWHLAKWGFAFDDSKWPSPLLFNLGFRMIPRREFRERLAAAASAPGKRTAWSVEDELATIADWRPGVAPPTAPESATALAPASRAATAPRFRVRQRAIVPLLPAIDPSLAGLGEALLCVI